MFNCFVIIIIVAKFVSNVSVKYIFWCYWTWRISQDDREDWDQTKGQQFSHLILNTKLMVSQESTAVKHRIDGELASTWRPMLHTKLRVRRQSPILSTHIIIIVEAA